MADLATPFEVLGGEPALRSLVSSFYRHMRELPDAEVIRKLHLDFPGAEEKLYLFLTGWLGGPPLYVEKHGPPMLRRRHFPFAIGEAERDQWMLCMRAAMKECEVPEPLRAQLDEAFYRLADHMRNR